MKFVCENCEKIHNDEDNIYLCAKCEKEVCVDCTEGTSLIDDEVVCEDCYAENMEYTYPQGFYDFGNGEDIEEEMIKEWLNSAKKCLQRSKEECDWTYTGSGNTIVFGTKTSDEYAFFVAKGYKELTVDAKDIDNVKF